MSSCAMTAPRWSACWLVANHCAEWLLVYNKRACFTVSRLIGRERDRARHDYTDTRTHHISWLLLTMGTRQTVQYFFSLCLIVLVLSRCMAVADRERRMSNLYPRFQAGPPFFQRLWGMERNLRGGNFPSINKVSEGIQFKAVMGSLFYTLVKHYKSEQLVYTY